MKLLLISSSTIYGKRYFEHVAEEVRAFLKGIDRLLFVPYALSDHDAYAAQVRAGLLELGLGVDSAHESSDPASAVASAGAILVGGGNTFRLLGKVYELGLIDVIRGRIQSGTPYIGSSAGSNLACPTIKTTNDMPIVQPPSFEALGLIPFQINPHFIDADPSSKHMGETRETRIGQFHEMNDTPVLGLREGAWVRVDGASATLGGTTGARLFQKGKKPEEYRDGDSLDFLLRTDR